MGEGESGSTRPYPACPDNGGPDTPPPVRPAGTAPIVVTATMGAADQRLFDALRHAHFPRDRNHLRAHITLFHQLPPSALGELQRLVGRIAADTPPPLAMLREVYSLGQGVAFRIDSHELIAIRARIADHFAGMLTAQDSGTPRLHITVQNKATPAEARALFGELASGFRPRPLEIVGLAAHHYRGGPWEPAFTRSFRARRR